MQLLLELFCEEIPARMQKRAAEDLKTHIVDGLKEMSLSFKEAQVFVTPRRLVILVDGIPQAQPDVMEERRGPRTDAPEKAVQGFLRGNNLTLDQCEKRNTEKGEFWFAVIDRKGRKTDQVLKILLPDAIHKLHWQKSMRWGRGSFRWVRPLERVMCVLDGELLPFELGDGIQSCSATTGHRFLGVEPFEVKFFNDYEKTLRDKKVVLNGAVRTQLIEEAAAALAEADGFFLKRDAGLLEEVAGLVEWPVPLIGKIDPEFMELPDEVLATSMRSHQKYFSVVDADGKLGPRFVVVSNMQAPDGGKVIVAGNERVLRARLADAKFFWDQDRTEKLENRVPTLSQMVFHEKLGNLEQKVRRIEGLSSSFAEVVNADKEQTERAAHLCKADLMTGMVGEFAGLQGVMGQYYALEEGEKKDVARAIAEHYAPAGPDDLCPTSAISIAVSLADKLDTLVGFFGINERPTGSRDPYGLRRAALGIIRLILENKVNIQLSWLVDKALQQYQTRDVFSFDNPKEGLIEFFVDRLKVYLRTQGARHDLVEAVAGSGDDNVLRLVQKSNSLADFLSTENGRNLLSAYKRACNIVQIEEKRDDKKYGLKPVDEKKFEQREETHLWEALTQLKESNPGASDMSRFDEMLGDLANLRAPVDTFFERVTVNTDQADIRENRLRLLSEIETCLNKVANFSCIDG